MRYLLVVMMFVASAAARSAPTLDQVVSKARAYLSEYEAQLENLVAEEEYVQRTTGKEAFGNASLKAERRIYSDIVMVQDGLSRFPVRCVRRTDGTFTEVGAYVNKDTVAALGARVDASVFRRSLNLPIAALSVLRAGLAHSYIPRKVSEERIGSQLSWKIAFDQKLPDRETANVTLWILPETGQVLRSMVDVNAGGIVVAASTDAAFKLRSTAQYEFNRRFNVFLPVSMEEVLDEPAAVVRGSATYSFIRKFSTGLLVSAMNTTAAVDSGQYKLVVDVPLVSLDVSVTGDAGAVTDLTTDDFSIEENGVRQQFTTFSPATVPYNVMLLFDWSDSTLQKRDLLLQAAAGFVEQLRARDWVGIGRFAGDLVMEGWTANRQQALRRLAELKDPLRKSGTRFYSSLESALTDQALPFVGRRRAMVILTDGLDNGYELTFMPNKLATGATLREALRAESQRYNRLKALIEQERVPMYIVAVNTADAGGASSDYIKGARQRLEEMARLSGGRVVFAASFEDAIPVYKQISREIGTAYTLGYYSNVDTSGTRQITVRTRNPDLKVAQSRSAYLAP